MTAWLFFAVIAVYLLCGLVSPFPYGRTYWMLWRVVLAAPGTWYAKRRQAAFLLKAGLGMPIWTFFWYLDELLYADYRRQEIKPVFIIGQPRCGTTFLHRTLAADRQTFFAIRHLEWRYPFIAVQKLIALLGLDKNLGGVNYWPKTEAGQQAAKMHPNTLADWEEDGIFFEENFLHHFFIFLRFPYPGLLKYVDSFPELPEHVQKRMLDVYVRTLQKVQFLRGEAPVLYLSKEVTSHKRIPALLSLFPEARFIVIVRPARDFMSSLTALMRMSTKSKTGIDPDDLPWWQDEFMSRMQDDSRRLVQLCQDVIPLSHQVRVSSNLFVSDPARAVAMAYEALGLPMHDEFAEHLAHLKKRQEQRQRGYDYSALSPQGFDEYDAFVREIDEAAVEPVVEHAGGRLGSPG